MCMFIKVCAPDTITSVKNIPQNTDDDLARNGPPSNALFYSKFSKNSSIDFLKDSTMSCLEGSF